MEVKEFEIPVPWGHIAVKTWGRAQNFPILAVHGLADNAGTFDRLLPYLPSSFYYICIDLPSHGKSSPYPPHLFISALDNIFTFKLIVDYLNLKKFIFLGHSWGGQAGVLFAQLYPEYIIKLIVLDSFYLFPLAVHSFKDTLIQGVDGLIAINEKIVKNRQPSYTYEDAVTKLMDNRFYGELTRESAETLIKRALIPVADENFSFSTDPRLKVFVNLIFGMQYVTNLVRKYPITCPVLFVVASDSSPQLYYFKSIVKEFKKNKKCVIKQVIGSHDVHNNSPEVVGPIIHKFLVNVTSKL